MKSDEATMEADLSERDIGEKRRSDDGG